MQTTETPPGLGLLALLALAVCGRAQDSCVGCNAQPNCKQVNTLNITIQQHANLSPYYQPILTSDPDYSRFNSVCLTFFPIDDTTYLMFRTTVDVMSSKANSSAVKVYIIADLPNTPGAYRVQGLYGQLGNQTTVYNVYIVDATCPGCQPVYIYYQCFIFDECRFVYRKDDIVNGISSTADNSPSCLNRFESLVRSKGLVVEGFVRPPGGPRRCVVNFNNSTCVNADRVDPADAIAYPEHSTSI